MTEYVELHASSAFSFLDAASLPEGLVKAAVERGIPAMALLDRNGVYGAARFHISAKANGIRAHIGAEIAVSDWPRAHGRNIPANGEDLPRISVLCESQKGYQNLCQLVTRFKMREKNKVDGAATLADLAEFADGLVCLTGGDEGLLAHALNEGGKQGAYMQIERLRHIFGPKSVYVELQRHGHREEEWRNQVAMQLASAMNLPLLATNGVRYATQYERELLDVFTSIRNRTDLEQAGRLLQRNSQRYVRSSRVMQAVFSDCPEALGNTRLLSDRLQFELSDLGYTFPKYPVGDDDTTESFLRKRVAEGIERRYGAKRNAVLFEKAKQQASRELDLIVKFGFEGYFLIVWDIIQYCKRNEILVQGRGSAANSVVCYALEITAIDPVGMDLLFERFLNESRKEWPDIDLDLPSGDKREKAIQYVYQRYGELGAAMTANVITYRGKSAAREVGKALGFDQETLGRLSGLISQWEWRSKDDTLAESFKHAGFDLEHRRIAKYVELCERMQDLPRHLGQHSGGMVICQGKLNQVVPIERASMVGRTVVQWDKEDCADMGMIKVDLLGLGMMAVVKDCLDLIPRHYGNAADLAQLPEDDPEVYDTLCQADTVGMFQVESRAQMASLPRNAPRKFYDLVVQVAIIRPGPIVGQMMHPYMRRRQKKEEVSYPVESLKPVLERTLGVPLFQEQLLRIAMVVGDFSGAEAEDLRKAVGMKRSWQRMEELMVKLRAGMERNGISGEKQDAIVQSIQSFALYGFPESHAASFALIAYASAYFKVKYLAAFTCAMLNNQPMGFYTPAVLVKDAQRHGLRVRPVDVQASGVDCTIHPDTTGAKHRMYLRLGLNYAKGLQRSIAEDIVSERQMHGPFASTDDLVHRVPALGRRELVLLASIGALNSLQGVEHRRDAIWQVEQSGRRTGPLLGPEGAKAGSLLRMMNVEERLVSDYSGTGLTTGPHPLAFRREDLRRNGILSAADLKQARDGSWVAAAGCVIARQRPGTALGFIFLSMEDETGITNVIVHPDLYKRERVIVSHGKFLKVWGKVQNQDSVIHVKAEHIEILNVTAADVRSHDFH